MNLINRDKLIEEIDKEIDDNFIGEEHGYHAGIDKGLKTAKFLAKEQPNINYKYDKNDMNNWNILEEKGLPPIGVPLIVTIKNNICSKPNELRYPVYFEKDSMKECYRWSWRYGDMAYDLIPEASEVVAWLELPIPYEPMPFP